MASSPAKRSRSFRAFCRSRASPVSPWVNHPSPVIAPELIGHDPAGAARGGHDHAAIFAVAISAGIGKPFQRDDLIGHAVERGVAAV